MPVYEYRCNKCGEKFDILRGLQDKETEVKCPRCGATETRRVYSFFGRGSSSSSYAPSRFG